MPIYEYSCKSCGKGFEHLARTMSEKAPACPSCGSAKVVKGLSSFSTTAASASAAGSCSSCPGREMGCAARAHTHGPGCGCHG